MTLPRPSELVEAAVRAAKRMLREYFSGMAAELAYYGLIATVPCIAAFIGIVALLGSDPETTNAIAKIAREGASTEAGETVKGAARHVLDSDGAAGVAVGAGLLTTLWVASVYLAAFRRAAYRVYGEDPGPAWRARPIQMGSRSSAWWARGRDGRPRLHQTPDTRAGQVDRRGGRDRDDLVDRPLAARPPPGRAGHDGPLQPSPSGAAAGPGS